MELLKLLTKATYFAAPFIWLELYGFDIVIGMFFFFCFLVLLDVVMWYMIARKYEVVGSKEWNAGFMNKVIWIILLAWVIAFLANMSYAIDNEDIKLIISAIVLLIMVIRIAFELISVLENLAIISKGRESQMLNRIVNIMLKLVGIWQKKLEQKVDKYTS